MACGERSQDAMMADRSQSHGRNATALLTVGIAPKLAGRDLRSEIRRDGLGGACKDAFPGIFGWRSNFLKELLRHIQNRIDQSQPPQIGDYRGSLRRCKYLYVRGAALRREDTEPHLRDLWPAAPEA